MGILEQIVEILGQIIGFFFAYHLLRLAYKLFTRKQFVSAVFVSWASAFVLLCSLHWFQVWAKSFITSNITSELTAFGQRVRTVEVATRDMHDQLASQQKAIDIHQQVLDEVRSNLGSTATNVSTLLAAAKDLRTQLAGHQTKIDNHQQELDKVDGEVRDAETTIVAQQMALTNQLDQVFLLQAELALAETNVSAQAKRLADMENLVRNLYGVMTNDPSRNQPTNVLH